MVSEDSYELWSPGFCFQVCHLLNITLQKYLKNYVKIVATILCFFMTGKEVVSDLLKQMCVYTQTVFCYHSSGPKMFKDTISHHHPEPEPTSSSCLPTSPISFILPTEVVFPMICQRHTFSKHSLILFRRSQQACSGQFKCTECA